jgi:hypothetical protein
VTEKHDAAHDTRGRHPENRLGLHYSRFPPISADWLLSAQLLAGRKLENPVVNRPNQVSIIGELRVGTSPRPVMATRLIVPEEPLRVAGWSGELP